MDNPAVSAPAVPGSPPGQQVDIGTETKSNGRTPSPASEPVTVVTQVPSKNSEGWRRVIRNFSPSCKSPDDTAEVHMLRHLVLQRH